MEKNKIPMHKGIYIIGLLFLLLASCTGDREVRALLDRAEVLMDSCPDSAYAIMQTVSSPNLRGSGDRVRSLYGLLRTMTDAMTGKGMTTDSLIRPAYIYYKELSGSDENTCRLGRSAFYLAQFEASRDSTKRAEDLFREAIKYSEQVEDWQTCYLAHSHLANSIKWSNTELAIELRKGAIRIYKDKCNNKPSNLISMLNSLSNDYMAAGYPDSAFACANEAYRLACEYQLDGMKHSAQRALSALYYETGNYQKALELAKQGMHGLTDQTRDAALFSLADCYLACDSLEQAKNTLLQIEQTNVELSYEVNKALCRVAVRQNEMQHINPCFDSLEHATVNMFSKIQQTKEDYYNDNIQKELKNERLAHQKQRQQIIFVSALSIVLVIAVAIFLIMRKNQRIAIQKRMNTIMIHRWDHKEYNNALTGLKHEIEEQKFQITQTEVSLQQEITDLLAEKESINSKYETARQKLLDYILTDRGLISKFRIDEQTDTISDSDWEQLEIILNHLNNNFVRNLRKDFPEMAETDVRICMLSLLRLSNTRIGQILKRDLSTVKRHKRIIKTKIFGFTDSDTDFEPIIASLYS